MKYLNATLLLIVILLFQLYYGYANSSEIYATIEAMRIKGDVVATAVQLGTFDAITLVLAILAMLLAFLGFFGWNTIQRVQKSAEREAKKEAERVLNEKLETLLLQKINSDQYKSFIYTALDEINANARLPSEALNSNVEDAYEESGGQDEQR